MNNTRLYLLLFVAFAAFFLGQCTSDYTPKPRGYFRIDLPEKQYTQLDTSFPYTFQYPIYTVITPDELSPHEPYWINIDYPQYKGRLHISYKSIHNNLIEYLEDARTMVVKHIPKASSIDEELILNPQLNLYGLKYKIRGLGAASPYQFFVTDSLRHFLRGALYFNTKPNNDSLAPLIDFIEEDIDHLIQSLRWKTR